MKEEPRILWWKGAGVSCPALSLTNYTSLTFQPWTGSRTEVTQPWALPVIAGWGGRGDQKRGTGGQSRSDFTLGVIQDKATGKSSSGSPKIGEDSWLTPFLSSLLPAEQINVVCKALNNLVPHFGFFASQALTYLSVHLCRIIFWSSKMPISFLASGLCSCCLMLPGMDCPPFLCRRTSAHSLRQHKCPLLWGVSLALLLLVTFSVPTAFWS